MQLALLILNSLGLAGLAYFIHSVFSGLRAQVAALKTLAEEQGKTLEAVRQRAEEFDRLSQGYKKALADWDEMGQKLEARRTQLVKELEEANAAKDVEIAAAKKLDLEQLELQRRSLEQLPDLVAKSDRLMEEIKRRFEELFVPAVPGARFNVRYMEVTSRDGPNGPYLDRAIRTARAHMLASRHYQMTLDPQRPVFDEAANRQISTEPPQPGAL